MIKRIKYVILYFLVLLSLVFVGESTFLYGNFKQSFSGEIIKDNVSQIIVDNYVGSSATPYASFTSVSSALYDAKLNSSNTNTINVYLRPGSFVKEENKALVVADYVNFYMPFVERQCDIANDNEIKELIKKPFGDSSEQSIKTNRKSCLQLINSDLTIEKNGSVFVGGTFGTKNIVEYTEISLDKDSSIIVNGSLTNYGYIKEMNSINVDNQNNLSDKKFDNSLDKNRFIEIRNTGYYKAPIFIYDLPGASRIMGLNGNNICPINFFDFNNTQTYITFNSGAKFDAQIRAFLETSRQSKIVNVSGTIVNNKINAGNSKSLFFLERGTLSFEYCPIRPGLTGNDASNTYISLFGDLSIGSLFFDLSVAKLDTTNMFLPMSHKMNIIIGAGSNADSSYKMKLLAGSIFYIQEGGNFTLNSQMAVYLNSTLDEFGYPIGKGDAQFINSGKFTLGTTSAFGGLIQTKCKTNAAICDFTNASTSNLVVESNEDTSNKIIRLQTTGVYYDSTINEYKNQIMKSGIAINSRNDGKMCRENGYLTSYSLKVSVININNYTNPLVGYKVYAVDKQNNQTLLTNVDGTFSNKTQDFVIEDGNRVKIELADGYEKAAFSDNSTIFKNNAIMDVNKNLELIVNPGQGCKVRFISSGNSGNSGSEKTVKVRDSSGQFVLYGSGGSGGSPYELIFKKGTVIQYVYKKGTGFSSLDKIIYKFNNDLTISDSKNAPADTSTPNVEKYTGTLEGSIFNKHTVVSPSITIDCDCSILARLK